jgi:hypothetical protein
LADVQDAWLESEEGRREMAEMEEVYGMKEDDDDDDDDDDNDEDDEDDDEDWDPPSRKTGGDRNGFGRWGDGGAGCGQAVQVRVFVFCV